MLSFKVAIFYTITSIIVDVQAHGLRNQRRHEHHHSGLKHETKENDTSRHSYGWTHDLGDMRVHETASVDELTRTVVMASTDRLLLQRHIRPAVTFHDFKTGLVAIKIRNKFKGHHKGYGGKHVRRAKSTCYIIPVRTGFTETMQELASRNGKTVVFRSSPRQFVTSSSTMADFERSAFRRKSHFLSKACHTSAIIDSQNMTRDSSVNIKTSLKIMSVWGTIVVKETFENHHTRIYNEFQNRVAGMPHGWRFHKYHG